MKAHEYGDVLMNLGTGPTSRKVERSIGLASQHAYAVLDLKEKEDQRLLLVKNPWSEGESWRGYSGNQVDIRAPASDSSFPAGWNADDAVKGPSTDSPLPQTEQPLTPGIFWIDLNKVMQHFESIYLNWNPGLFASRQDIHFSWDLSIASMRGSPSCYANHPQLSVTTRDSGTLWLLLSRHFKNASIDVQEQRSSTAPIIDLDGHISLSVHDRNGEKVYMYEDSVKRGPFVDSPQTLLRLDVSGGRAYTVVIAEQKLSSTLHTFTLSAFAQSPIILGEATSRFKYSQTSSSSWTPATAGGNGASHTYSSNPQFSITVHETTAITMLLETLVPDVNVHLKLVYSSGGQRITTPLKRRDILGDSGDYRKQSCIAELKTVNPGTYTIIASTFESGQHAGFSLRADSNAPIILKALPGENAGRLPVQLSPAYFPISGVKMACQLKPRKTVKLAVEARLIPQHQPANSSASSTISSPLKLTIEHGWRYDCRTIAQSNGGEYAESAGSIRTGDVDLWPDMLKQGQLWLVLERLVGGCGASEEQYMVQMWFEGTAKPEDAVEIGAWRELERD